MRIEAGAVFLEDFFLLLPVGQARDGRGGRMGFRYGGDSLPAEEPLLPEEGIGAAISGLLLLQPAG